MDTQDPAQQELFESFRRDQVQLEAHPPRKPGWWGEMRHRLWVFGILGVIFVVAVLSFVFVYPRFGPVDTMTAFCTAEEEGRYTDAYALLAQSVQQRITPAAFTQTSKNTSLEGCDPRDGIPIVFGQTHSTIDVSYTFFSTTDVEGSPDVEGSISFVHEKDGWRVLSMDPDLLHLNY